MCGPLQGGKLSALAGAVDPRVKAVCLLDPVDNTVYAPEGPDYPSAVAAVRHAQAPLAMAVVGCGRAGDCVPRASNYRRALAVPCSHARASASTAEGLVWKECAWASSLASCDSSASACCLCPALHASRRA